MIALLRLVAGEKEKIAGKIPYLSESVLKALQNTFMLNLY